MDHTHDVLIRRIIISSMKLLSAHNNQLLGQIIIVNVTWYWKSDEEPLDFDDAIENEPIGGTNYV